MQCVNISSLGLTVPICTSQHDKMLKTLVKSEMSRDIYGLKHLHTQNGIGLDIGAHVGTTAILLSLMYPKMKIYSFEPSPINFKYLTYNVANLNLGDRIHTYHNAVSMHDETIEFEHSPDDSTSSKATRLGKTWGKLPKSISHVKSISIMTILNKIDHFDFIKLDCEGCEVELIPMIIAIYTKNPDCHLAGEFHEWHLRTRSNVSNISIKKTRSALCKFHNRFIERLKC